MWMHLDGHPASADDVLPLGLYNYGHFTSMLVDQHRVKAFDLHCERLRRDCLTLFGAELDTDSLAGHVRRAADATTQPTVVRVTVHAPELELGRPDRSVRPRVLVTTRLGPSGPLPALRLRSVRYVRDLPSVKHVGLFGSLYHRRQVQRAGYDDALFVDDDGHISEGATWNVVFLDGDHAHSPKADCLDGIGRRVVRDCLETLGVSVAETVVDIPRAQTMQAAFATNAVWGIRPIAAIDDVTLPGDEYVTVAAQAAYEASAGTDLRQA
jgi:branched-subunit amino acid aminotransferase/4-amino-4-deoxychorismate lyase